MRSLSLSIWLVALSAAGCLAESDPAPAAPRGPTELRLAPVALHPDVDRDGRAIPGTLVFDTTGGRLDLTPLVPERPREFASRAEFHAWAIATLNARVLERADGEPLTQVDVAAPTTVRYDRAIDDLAIVDDPIAAIVGGDAGYVVIAGEPHCVSRTAPCAHEPSIARLVTRTAGGFGIMGTSWTARSTWYESVGAATAQWNAATGIRLRWAPCGWACWTLSATGSNLLTAAFVDRRAGATGTAAASNTLAVMASRVTFGLRPATATAAAASHFGISGPDALAL